MAPPIIEETIPAINEEYNFVLGELLEGGMDFKEAAEVAQNQVLNKNEDLDHYLGQYATEEEIRIRKTILLSDLELLPDSITAGGWNRLALSTKNSILFGLGMSVHLAGWWEQVGYVKSGPKTVLDKYILSEERMDKEWLTTLVGGVTVASEGAVSADWTKRHTYYDMLKDYDDDE